MRVAEQQCVVCNGRFPSGTARYANAWEASLRQRPCCSEACVAKFDADLHWMPATAPARADAVESERLLRGGLERLRRGDAAASIARDLLLGGAEPETVRRAISGVAARADAARSLARGASLASGLRMLFAPRRDATAIRAGDAFDQIDAWNRRFR